MTEARRFSWERAKLWVNFADGSPAQALAGTNLRLLRHRPFLGVGEANNHFIIHTLVRHLDADGS